MSGDLGQKDYNSSSANANDNNNNNGATSSCSAVRMVIQRYRSAKLLIAEKEMVTVGTPSDFLTTTTTDASTTSTSSDGQQSSTRTTAGILVYISFAKTVTHAKVEQAARTLLNLPVLTLGAWGDGSSTQSILHLSAEEYHHNALNNKDNSDNNIKISPLSLLLVPQANLTAKVKKLGKSIQYRDQCAKSEGQALYEYFVEYVKQLLIEHMLLVRQGQGLGLHNTTSNNDDTNSNKNKNNHTGGTSSSTPDPSIPPSQLFHQDDTYGSFEQDEANSNEQTFPLTYANGEPLTKSARKKLQKIYNAHVQRYAKYLQSAPSTSTAAADMKNTPKQEEEKGEESLPSCSSTTINTSKPQHQQQQSSSSLDPSFVQLVAGSFGKRQGLELQSDMGPFCHVVEIE